MLVLWDYFMITFHCLKSSTAYRTNPWVWHLKNFYGLIHINLFHSFIFSYSFYQLLQLLRFFTVSQTHQARSFFSTYTCAILSTLLLCGIGAWLITFALFKKLSQTCSPSVEYAENLLLLLQPIDPRKHLTQAWSITFCLLGTGNF